MSCDVHVVLKSPASLHKSQEVRESTKEELHTLKSVYCDSDECSIVTPSWLNFDNLGTSDICSVGEIVLCVTLTIHYMRSSLHAYKHSSTTEYCEDKGVIQTVVVDVVFTLTDSYPHAHPIISLSSSHLCQIILHKLEQCVRVYAQSLVPEHCLFDVLEKLKEDILKTVHAHPENVLPTEEPHTNATQCICCDSLDCQPDKDQSSSSKHNAKSSQLVHSILIARIDHMRNETKYFKLLNSWAKQLQLSGNIFNTGLHSIYAVITGRIRDVDEFLKRWKTQCVDVDSRGCPCKEKMLSILCQEVIKEKMMEQPSYVKF